MNCDFSVTHSSKPRRLHLMSEGVDISLVPTKANSEIMSYLTSIICWDYKLCAEIELTQKGMQSKEKMK